MKKINKTNTFNQVNAYGGGCTCDCGCGCSSSGTCSSTKKSNAKSVDKKNKG